MRDGCTPPAVKDKKEMSVALCSFPFFGGGGGSGGYCLSLRMNVFYSRRSFKATDAECFFIFFFPSMFFCSSYPCCLS